MRKRTFISLLVYPPVSAVLVGGAAIAVLSIPFPADWIKYLLPAAIVVALIASVPVAWQIAPRLRIGTRPSE